MKKLAEILTVLFRYSSDGELAAPHDALLIVLDKDAIISSEDIAKLKKLGCNWDDQEDCWRIFI